MYKNPLSALYFVVTLFLGVCNANAQLVQMRNTGEFDRRVDIVILGDGYQANEMNTFRDDANEFVAQFFSFEPFATYEHFFNISRIETPSNTSGAGQGVGGDTYYGSYFACNPGIQRLVCVDETIVESVLNANGYNTLIGNPEFVLMLVNDDEWGGSGGAGIAITTTGPGWLDIAMHEIGHSFASLGDEYEDPALCTVNENYLAQFPTGFDDVANVSNSPNRQQTPWGRWFPNSTTGPIPDIDDPTNPNLQIDIFEGAIGCSNGWYRPSQLSMMRTDGQPFGNINSEQIVRTIWPSLYHPEDIVASSDAITSVSYVPAPGLTRVTLTSPNEFYYMPNHPIGLTFYFDYPAELLQNFEFRWSVDGVTKSNLGIVSLRRSDFPTGFSTLDVEITDITNRVMGDPDNRRTRTGSLLVFAPPNLANINPPTPGTLGAACSSNSECTPGPCQGGRCVCDDDLDCGAAGSGRTCIRRATSPNSCGNTGLANGAFCSRNRQCLSNRCKREDGLKVCVQ